jgi:hypothetical protein
MVSFKIMFLLEFQVFINIRLHAFAPILPEHIDQFIFYQPFPYIYGIHTSIYQKLSPAHLNESVILLVDEHEVLNADNDHLPKQVVGCFIHVFCFCFKFFLF